MFGTYNRLSQLRYIFIRPLKKSQDRDFDTSKRMHDMLHVGIFFKHVWQSISINI